MPHASSKSSKSLPPLPTAAATHASTSSDAAQYNGDNSNGTRRSCVTNNCIRTTVTLLVFAAYIAWTWPWYFKHGGDEEVGIGSGVSGEDSASSGRVEAEGTVHAPSLPVPKSLQTKWAQYSPWHPRQNYPTPPAGCNVTQVHILQRHGARYPNADDGEQYSDAVSRLTSANRFTDKHLKWLKDYEYELGSEDLVPFGAAQSFEAGQIAYKRYQNLVDLSNVPYVRASGAPRVISTATNWTVGFAVASHQRHQPYLNTIISEEHNNTLNQDCPSATSGSEQTSIWLSIFAPPLVARLNKAAPGAKLNTTHIFDLLAMCPFESVWTETLSPFCNLFTEDDFRSFEYYGDLEKYYKTGYGNPLGRIRGVGYVNELLARLTEKPVQDHTTHNSSLEFPLDRTIYADFTHENLMVAVYAALGLFNVSEPLNPRSPPSTSVDADRQLFPHGHLSARQAHLQENKEQEQEKKAQTWVASHMVPFSSRMVSERLTCVRDSDEGGEPEEVAYVRILVNDEPQPLEFCGAGRDRMCTLQAFVESQGYVRRSGDGDFEKCYK